MAENKLKLCNTRTREKGKTVFDNTVIEVLIEKK